MYSYRLRKLITDGVVKQVIALPQNPVYKKGKTYWCGYWQKYYTVLDVIYKTIGKREHLNQVTIQWEDGRIATHKTNLDTKHDYILILNTDGTEVI
jgi:hypothetical protein